MSIDKKATGLQITSEIENPGKFLDRLVTKELSFYEESKHDKGDSASLTFEGGSIAKIHTVKENGEPTNELHVHYRPGEQENNFNFSEKVLEALKDAFTGKKFSINYLTVGGITEKNVEEILGSSANIESTYDIKGIELEQDNYLYGIAQINNEDAETRTTVRVEDPDKSDPQELKIELNQKLEEFINE